MTVALTVAVLGLLAVAAGTVTFARSRYLLVTVRGPSMEPTLRDGDRVLVRRSDPRLISAGDLVVFEETARRPGSRRARPAWVIKRVRAVPGDPVPLTDVRALAGVEHEVVPASSLVVLGDNPGRSHDSRAYGYLDAGRVFGVVIRELQRPRLRSMTEATTKVETTTAGAYVVNRADGRTDGEDWTENLEGKPFSAGISIIQESTTEAGHGPRLHKHPYPETFIIRRGSALFTIGTEEVVGRAGQILIVPAGTPHKFRTLEGGYEAVHIHAADEFVTEWLE